jgi:undecaprenyl diphosphate synthase
MTSPDSPDVPIPQHVAVIMDGNGRWARSRALPRIAGHRQGVETVRALVNACGRKGVGYLTLFAFSSENWRRPPLEVRLLKELFLTALNREAKRLHDANVKFRVIGDIAAFGDRLVERIREAERLTAGNTGLNLLIAANYGGRWDITQAVRVVARRAVAGDLNPEKIEPGHIEQHLSLAGIPEPDLFIRTGGESRISNFLLWQLAYTELYFTPVLWPDFDEAQFDLALQSFAARQRRFGRTGEQIEAEHVDKEGVRRA